MGACASAARDADAGAGEGWVGVERRASGGSGADARGRAVREGETASDGSERDGGDDEGGDDVARRFDPLEIEASRKRAMRADGKRAVARKLSRELYPNILEALQSRSEPVRHSAEKVVRDGNVDEETERKFQYLMNLPVVMPKPFDANARLTAREVPQAPITLSQAFGEAIKAQDFEWAKREEISSLFSRDVDYLNVHGEFFQGKEDVLKSLCESVRRLSQRLRLSSARGDGETLKKYTKMTTTGPNYKGRGTEREWSSWVIDYTFKVLLLTIKIRETYYIDDTNELICHIARERIY